jgi:hypothetical protein
MPECLAKFVLWPPRQDSANQLNPVLLCGGFRQNLRTIPVRQSVQGSSTREPICLETNNDSSRNADIVLMGIEQSRVDVISLNAPREDSEDLVIEAAAYGCSE